MFTNSGFSLSNRTLLAGVLTLSLAGFAQAEGKRCVVVHVPQDDPAAFTQAINVVSNLPNQLGVDNVTVELAAQGPGLKLLTEGSPEAQRIQSIIAQSENTMGGGVKFSACAATIAGIKKKTGKEPVLLPGVGVVHPGAAVRVMELQEQGCSYMRI